jgi:hypothetical protein
LLCQCLPGKPSAIGMKVVRIFERQIRNYNKHVIRPIWFLKRVQQTCFRRRVNTIPRRHTDEFCNSTVDIVPAARSKYVIIYNFVIKIYSNNIYLTRNFEQYAQKINLQRSFWLVRQIIRYTWGEFEQHLMYPQQFKYVFLAAGITRTDFFFFLTIQSIIFWILYTLLKIIFY